MLLIYVVQSGIEVKFKFTPLIIGRIYSILSAQIVCTVWSSPLVWSSSRLPRGCTIRGSSCRPVRCSRAWRLWWAWASIWWPAVCTGRCWWGLRCTSSRCVMKSGIYSLLNTETLYTLIYTLAVILTHSALSYTRAIVCVKESANQTLPRSDIIHETLHISLFGITSLCVSILHPPECNYKY